MDYIEMKKKDRLKILFLPAWYPSEKHAVFGVFIKEHAKAVSLYDEVVVLYSEGSGKDVKGLYEVVSDEKEDGIRTIRTRHRELSIPKTTYFIYLWSIFTVFRRLLKEGWRPDVIHAHVFSAAVPAAILQKIYRIPLVITEHSTNFATHSLRPIEQREAKFAMSRAQIILPVSVDLRHAIEDYYGIKNKFKVVQNVVNTKVFCPLTLSKEKDSDKKRMLSVCILVPRKGIHYLLESLFQLKQKRQDFVLDIVGDGPNRGEYEELSSNLGLSNIVKFYGRQPEVVSFMRNCDFLVLPSLYENFGVVYIEAMACGKPVIGTNAGGSREIITKETGILVQPEDTNALTKAIDYMLDHYQDYSQERISQYAKDKFSYEIVGKKLDDVYRNTLANNFRDYPVGNSGYKIKIRDDWKVLDVGSGHNPHPRANVILDKYIENDTERSGKPIKVREGQEFVNSDACNMPFNDKKFDYIIASHIAEHVDDPEMFCNELMRVGKRGYIETPSKFTEKMLGEVCHKWYVYAKNDTLIFERKTKLYPLGLLGKVFYAIYYVNIKRVGKPTLYFHNKYLQAASNILVHYFLRKPWTIFKKLTYTSFEWQNRFNYKIIDRR